MQALPVPFNIMGVGPLLAWTGLFIPIYVGTKLGLRSSTFEYNLQSVTTPAQYLGRSFRLHTHHTLTAVAFRVFWFLL